MGLSIVVVLGLAFTGAPSAVPWPDPVYDEQKNPLHPQQVELGRILFYDPILSKDSTISCASCHSPYQAFAHGDHALSHGIHDSIGTRNAPALFNLAWSPILMWDGAIHHLEVQSLSPITHPGEMGETLSNVLHKLNHHAGYRKRFYGAFSDSTIRSEMLLKSLAQFMRSLISRQSRYDSLMRNQIAFTPQEISGYTLFKQHCNRCHTEPLFTSFAFENNGLPIDPMLQDIGRAKISGNPSDSFKFKVPSLRNIEFTYPYMHDGRFKTLREVFQHYLNVKPSPYLSPALQQGIVLNDHEQKDLMAFLLTLSDRKFVFDTTHTFPLYLLQSPAKE